MLHALEDETGRSFHFTGSEGLPLDHFAIVEEGARAEIEEQSVPFREGEEVHVDIVEPHMYSEDDAVAKVDGYLIEVRDAIAYVGEKMLVRIEQAGRTAARAVLAEVAEEAAAATDERRKARERAAKRAATAARARKKAAPKAAPTPEDEAVETLADDDARARRDRAGGRRRGRRGRGAPGAPPVARAARRPPTRPRRVAATPRPRPTRRATAQSRRRRRGRGGTTTRYHRSLGAAAAEADGAVRVRSRRRREVSEASE